MNDILPASKFVAQNDYAVTLKFEEVGVLEDGAEVGTYAGTAHIDQDGFVVGLELDVLVPDKTNPTGPSKFVSRYYPVPREEHATSFAEQRSVLLATTIERGCVPEINEKLNEWHVERAEESFSPEREYGTYRAIGGHVA